MINAPFFNLDELAQQVFDSPATNRDRVVRRLNGALLKMSETWKGPEELDERTRSLYASKRQAWLAGDRKAAWQRRTHEAGRRRYHRAEAVGRPAR